MRLTFGISALALAFTVGCPKPSATEPAPPIRTKPTVVRPAVVDAGVPVVTKPLPPYKTTYTRPKVRLYTSGGVPWFRSRVKRPKLATLPYRDVELPPGNLVAEVAALAALKRADPKQADFYRLKSVLAYRSYQRAAAAQRTRKTLEELVLAATSWRRKYRWRKRIRVLRTQIRKHLVDAAAKYKELAISADAKTVYPNLPRALYQYGLVLAQQKQTTAALKWWEDIARDGANAEATRAAHLALADHYFRRSSFGTARRHYEYAAAHPIKSVKTSVNYWRRLRYAWTLVRTRDAKRGFAELVKLPRRYVMSMKSDEVKLMRATVELVAPWAYAGYGRAAGAMAALRQINRRETWQMLRSLADIYGSKRQRPEAIAVYKILLSKQPSHQDVCLWRFYAVAQQLVGEPSAKTIKTLENLIAMYKQANDARLLPSEGQRKCETAVRAISTTIARRMHRRARRKPTAANWLAADKLYKLHLDTFTPATRVHANYAELRWRRAELEQDPKLAFKLWKKAAREFRVLSHRNTYKLLQDKAKRAAAKAWSNAAAIAETGYINGPDNRTANYLYGKACKIGRSIGFTKSCADERSKLPVATPVKSVKPTTTPQPKTTPAKSVKPAKPTTPRTTKPTKPRTAPAKPKTAKPTATKPTKPKTAPTK